MFNDNVSMGYFDVYDQYLLNMLYDPRIKAGMTVQEVRAVLPDVLADVRAWVSKVNNLPELRAADPPAAAAFACREHSALPVTTTPGFQ